MVYCILQKTKKPYAIFWQHCKKLVKRTVVLGIQYYLLQKILNSKLKTSLNVGQASGLRRLKRVKKVYSDYVYR